MADSISKITLPDNHTYELIDLGARRLIQDLSSAGISFIISSTAGDTPLGITWTKGETLVTGTLQPSGTITGIYLVPVTNTGEHNIYAEYICARSGEATYIWEKLGTTEAKIGDLGALAYKNEAKGSVTVLNTVSASFTNGSASVSGRYTPEGNVTSTFSGSSLTSTGSVTPKGTVGSTLSGASADVSINYTPVGKNSAPTATVTPATTSVATVTTNGSVTAGTAASFTEGTFNPGSFTQGKDTFTAPTLTTTVSDQTLIITFDKGSFTQGTDKYVKPTKGADTFSAGRPTAVTLPTFGSKDVLTGVDVKVAAPVFTGTKATLTQTASVTGIVTSTFTGSASSVSVTGTPKGTVESTFRGTAKDISSTGTATGTVNITTSTTSKTITVK